MTGRAFMTPPFNRFDRNMDGFCSIITLLAAAKVEKDIHITNFAGLNMIVGRPINIASRPKPTATKSKYIACVT